MDEHEKQYFISKKTAKNEEQQKVNLTYWESSDPSLLETANKFISLYLQSCEMSHGKDDMTSNNYKMPLDALLLEIYSAYASESSSPDFKGIMLGWIDEVSTNYKDIIEEMNMDIVHQNNY